ncbi:hypothetical protein HJC23_008026 [Cyclotella cryptica]|uniref:Reverse transcriptase domain-containing protein n=1 Tax=Cyclotella cryptica TaxID=29204 RepID=A0ABD3Q324_9STRA
MGRPTCLLLPSSRFTPRSSARCPHADPIDLLPAAFKRDYGHDRPFDGQGGAHDQGPETIHPHYREEIFAALCPNYTSKPHVVLESIKQWSTDKEGTVKIQTVREYYTRFSLAARPFAQVKTMPVDVCSLFIHGLHRDLKAQFDELYPAHAEPHDRSGRYQRAKLAEIFKKAVIAEAKVKTVERLVSSVAGQSFVTEAFPSQANAPSPHTRIVAVGGRQRGEEGGGRSNRGRGYERKGVMEAAMKARTARHAAYDAARAAKKKASQQMDFDKLDNADKKRWPSKSCSSSPTRAVAPTVMSPSPPKKAKRSVTIKTAHTFLYTIEEVPVLATTSRRPNLPVSIDTNLPHIPLQFGPSLDSANNPTVMSVVDTPQHLLPVIYSSLPAAPRAEGDDRTSARVHFPPTLRDEWRDSYETNDRLRADVSVNLILGLPFIKATRMVIDAAENVVECRLLDCEPFPIESKRARLEIPKADACLSETVTKECGSLLQDLEALESHWAGVYAIDPSTGATLSVKKGPNRPSFPNASRFMDNFVGPELGTGDETEAVSAAVWPPFVTYSHRAAYAPTPTGREVVAESYNVKVDKIKPGDPIRVAPKGKKGRRRDNVFFDDRGFPDVSGEFDYLLHRTGGGKVIRKRLHPSPRIGEIDEQFNVQYEEAKHGEKLRRELKIDHLTPTQQDKLVALIKKYWAVFDDTGLFVPVKDYECVIDTGSARPISRAHQPDSSWSMALQGFVSPKPHQEHITDIDDFVWRFCSASHRYPIPRCDSAVMLAFGKAKWFWLKDAPSGYNQLRVEESPREKLAFAGPGAIKWHYNVMPFGPVNGPVIFIAFIHDMDATWKELATSRGITIDEDTNTKIIVDDIWSHSVSFEKALAYMECQFAVCKAQRLSLSLKKCHFFPPRIEFVGIDVTVDGNHPAMSKHDLLKSWPLPKIVRDVSSFLGFAVFYSSFIPLFELRVLRLRQITREESTAPVTTLFDKEAADEWEDIKQAILSDPCLRRFDYKATLSSNRLLCIGWLEASAPVRPADEGKLHSYLGEAFAGDWAKINGPNPAVQRVQMRIMCDDCDVIHRNRCWNVDADYFSYLGKDLCPIHLVAPITCQCDQRICQAIADPESNSTALPTLLPQRLIRQSTMLLRLCCLRYYSMIVMGTIASKIFQLSLVTGLGTRSRLVSLAVSLYNSDLPVAAYQIARSTWAIHGYNCGHFMSSIQSRSLPFGVVLASDPTPQGRAQLQEFTACRLIFSGVAAMFSHLTRDFWQLQLSLIVQLRKLRSLAIVVAFLPPTHDSRAANQFASGMKRDGWLGSSIDLYFPHSRRLRSIQLESFEFHPLQYGGKCYYTAVCDTTRQSTTNVGLLRLAPIQHSVSEPKPGDSDEAARSAKTKYLLHRMSADASVAVGAQVLSLDGLCPPFQPQPNVNLFQNSFGIEFVHDGHVFVRPFSPFELARCFCLSGDITHALSQPDNIRNANIELFDPSRHAAPAACCQAFVNGAVGTSPTGRDQWITAYAADPQTSKIKEMVSNPALVVKEHLALLEPISAWYRRSSRNPVYCVSTQTPLVATLILIGLTRGCVSVLLARNVQVLPDDVQKCPGCALANGVIRASSELIYSFPSQPPSVCYMSAVTKQATFPVLKKANSTSFAKALMKIILTHGIPLRLCSIKIANSTARSETCDLLQMNVHTLSGDNHKGMLVERFNRYLNRGLRVLMNERESVRVSDEAIDLLAYAWNSAPVAGTDLSSYAKNQATLMAACHDVAKVLLDEHRKWHQELVNSSRPDPRQWQVGDIVFARRQTRSHKGRGIVGKLQFAHTGPWRIVSKLDGASYELQHCITAGDARRRPDNRYGQINRPIGLKPYLQAGLEGFEPLQPFKLPPSVDLATASHACRTFHWPSLSELNDEMSPFPWETGEHEQVATMTDDDIVHASLYHGPLLRCPLCIRPDCLPRLPSLPCSSRAATGSSLFPMSYLTQGDVNGASFGSTWLTPWPCAPPASPTGGILSSFTWSTPTSETHLIRPSESSEQLALRHNLSPLRQWVTLTHEAVYIHGPFDFASISGRKSRDRVDAARWSVLAQQKVMYSNLPPRLELPTYSVHADRGIHLTIREGRAAELLLSVIAGMRVMTQQAICDYLPGSALAPCTILSCERDYRQRFLGDIRDPGRSLP